MAFWKKTDLKEEKEPTGGAVEDVSAEPKDEARNVSVERSAQPGSTSALIGIIRSAHMTEKTTRSPEERTYVFRVSPRANKITVRASVEARYGVNVDGVRMLNTAKKARVRGRIIGWKPGFKKAMVTIREGQKIEIQ